jgi:hypothetical protein
MTNFLSNFISENSIQYLCDADELLIKSVLSELLFAKNPSLSLFCENPLVARFYAREISKLLVQQEYSCCYLYRPGFNSPMHDFMSFVCKDLEVDNLSISTNVISRKLLVFFSAEKIPFEEVMLLKDIQLNLPSFGLACLYVCGHLENRLNHFKHYELSSAHCEERKAALENHYSLKSWGNKKISLLGN